MFRSLIPIELFQLGVNFVQNYLQKNSCFPLICQLNFHSCMDIFPSSPFSSTSIFWDLSLDHYNHILNIRFYNSWISVKYFLYIFPVKGSLDYFWPLSSKFHNPFVMFQSKNYSDGKYGSYGEKWHFYSTESSHLWTMVHLYLALI